MKTKRFLSLLTIPDIILVVIIVAITTGWSVTHLGKQERKSVYVYKNNNLFGVYSPDEHQVIKIDRHNTIEIKNGNYRMLTADCLDKRCVKQGFSSNLPIICLPNQVVIEMKSDEKSKLILH